MAERRVVAGAMAPLFDRLRSSKAGGEHQPLRALTPTELRDSVARELDWLLNTRSPTLAAEYASRTLTILDYGLPDLSGFSAQNSDDQRRIERLISRAVSAFEPRLEQRQVVVSPHPAQPQQLCVSIEGHIGAEPVLLTLHLPVGGGLRTSIDLQPLSASEP